VFFEAVLMLVALGRGVATFGANLEPQRSKFNDEMSRAGPLEVGLGH
jgi:hypothetical protein